MSNSIQSNVSMARSESEPNVLFHPPANCPFAVCSAVEMCNEELQLRRAIEAGLRETLLRKSESLRQKDELMMQKDILAKESEHRLLNGLQLVNSVLAMEGRSATSPYLREQLCKAAMRVSALARVHQHLHTLEKCDSVEFKQFLVKLCSDLTEMASSQCEERSICVEGSEFKIPQFTATALGYIASELITNSIKYASGKISISLTKLPNGDAVLSVADDGPGLSKALNPVKTSGLGMTIIAALVSQIRGELTYAKANHGQGARFSVQFNPSA